MALNHSDRWADVERLLGTDPEYGDGAAIEQRALARLRVGLTMLADLRPERSQAVRRCAEASDLDLRAMSRDPVLRNAFETDLQTVAAHADGGSLLHKYLPAEGGYAVSRRVGGTDNTAWRSSGSAWVWTEVTRRSGDPVAERLRFLFDQQFPDSSATVPIEASAAELTMIECAADLLTKLMPTVASSVLGNVGMVGLARDDRSDDPLHSVSGGDHFPATIFVARESLENVWDAAGLLLHEGLHLVLFEIIRCGAVVFDHVDSQAEIVPIPWRREAWSLMRVLFALHVYVHLAVFHDAARSADAEIRQRFGEPPPDAAVSRASTDAARFSTPEQRARYLAAQLMLRSDLFTVYGRNLVAWLTGALDLLAPAASDDRLAATFQAVDPVAAVSLPEQRRLVVALADPPRVRWLNLSSWLLYALCDGRDAAAIREEYAASVADVVPRAEALRQVDAALSTLLDEGMVVVRYDGLPRPFEVRSLRDG
jgi:hypothetical protein